VVKVGGVAASHGRAEVAELADALDSGARAADVENFCAPEVSSETDQTGTPSDRASDAETVARELIRLAAEAEQPLDFINAAECLLVRRGDRELGKRLLARAAGKTMAPEVVLVVLRAVRVLLDPTV
jgi:hypothetical protein